MRVTVPNFVGINQIVQEIKPFFIFQDGGRPPSWILKIWKFEHLVHLEGRICIIILNFVLTGQTVTEIWPFSFLR